MATADPNSNYVGGSGSNGEIHETAVVVEDQDKPVVDSAEDPTPTPPKPKKATRRALDIVSKIRVLLTWCPFIVIILLVSFAWFGDLRFRRKRSKSRKCEWEGKGAVYAEIDEFQTKLRKFKRITVVAASRVGCLLLSWLLVNLLVPSLRSRTLSGGTLLWKWSLLATVVSLGYPCTIITISLFTTHLLHPWIDLSTDAFYYVISLEDTVIGLLYGSWVLFAWLLYFRTDRGLDLVKSQPVDKYVTCTLVSFQVGAILWGLKKVIWLKWMADVICKRFKPRIIMAGFQLFFLSLIVDGTPLRNFQRSWVKQYSELKRLSIYQVNWIANLVAHLAKLESRETDDFSEIIKQYEQKIQANHNLGSEDYVTEEALKSLMEDFEAKLFLEQLQMEHPSENIEEVPFLKWMVDAHKSCVSMGHTLRDAFATVSVLDTILTCCVVAAVILLWLLITELATIKVLILIASPFLAFTFVFGDSCKAFFQGVIFSFITHPFDVGDRCIIDGVEVEVKRINILTTTCFKIGTKEKMLYPNANLATKVIINLESKPDPRDVIELALDSSTKTSRILRLRRRIKEFIHNDRQRNAYERFCQVRVKEIGSDIKISIGFKHAMTVRDTSHTQFIKMKNKRRSLLLIKIRQFAENLNIKLAQT